MNLPALLNKLKDPLWKEVRDWITLIVAAVAAFIYWFQLGVMQQNMKIDQRPWVVIKFERPQISSGSPVKTHGIASNIGKTPALVPTGEFDIALLHSNESPALQFAESEIHIRDTMQILYPADTRDINVYAWRKDKSRFLLTQADVDGLQSGEIVHCRSWLRHLHGCLSRRSLGSCLYVVGLQTGCFIRSKGMYPIQRSRCRLARRPSFPAPRAGLSRDPWNYDGRSGRSGQTTNLEGIGAVPSRMLRMRPVSD